MQIYQGKPVFEGIAIGKIRIHKQGRMQISFQKVPDAQREIRRFQEAKEKTLAKLQELYRQSYDKIGAGNASMLEAHTMFLADVSYIEDIVNSIEDLSCNAEYAVAKVEAKYRLMFESLSDDYMKARALDLQDVSERLLEALSGDEGSKEEDLESSILLTEEMIPSELMRMDKSRVLALVLTEGSLYSHTAILARTMGIPTLIQVEIPGNAELDGKLAVVDSEKGVLMVEPDDFTIEQSKHRIEQERLELEELAEGEMLDIQICANIGSLKDLERLKGKIADGIGLLRSEFIFFEKDNFPTEEEQFEIYRTVLQAMSGKKVVIRVLDMGTDKQCEYFPLDKEENPALGLRGIRVLLANEQILRTQLRALLRASVYGELHLLYPMITGVEEVYRIKEILVSVEKELQEQGITYGHPKQGVMIETPAAVMISDILAKEVDFFSIGTNDLTQYTLAMDRQSPRLAKEYDPKHPAVLRMIGMVVENAHSEGINVAICGELSADATLTETFMQMGVDELSVAPGYLSSVRKKCKACEK